VWLQTESSTWFCNAKRGDRELLKVMDQAEVQARVSSAGRHWITDHRIANVEGGWRWGIVSTFGVCWYSCCLSVLVKVKSNLAAERSRRSKRVQCRGRETGCGSKDSIIAVVLGLSYTFDVD